MRIAAMLKEKAAEKPTYPKYNSGGWMAMAGSCKMGLKPNPLGWDGIILSKGFDAVKMKTKKPIVMKACICRALETKMEFVPLYNL
jgi:hypothetical protein